MSTFYLTAQMVGGGVLVKTLIGIDYEISVIVVGVLMLAYVLFGGMVATTWVQIIKAVLLVTASIVLVMFVWTPYGFSLPAFLAGGRRRSQGAGAGRDAAGRRGEEHDAERARPALPRARAATSRAPIDQISLGMALVFGTAGLPHILMRFFTVPTAQEARKSVIWAMAIIGGFYVLTLFLGMGAAMQRRRGERSARSTRAATWRRRCSRSTSAAAPDSMLGNLFLAFVAAVAFATIVAVVAGLVLAAASAMAHDLYVGVHHSGEHVPPQEQVRAARIATVIVGALAIAIGILAKGQNVAHLVALAFAVAASANFPCVLLTLYWKRCNTGGIVLGMIVGTLTAIGLVLVSPNMTYPQAVKAAAQKIVDAAPRARLRSSTRDLAAATDDAGEGAGCQRRSPALEKDVAAAKAQPRASSRATTRRSSASRSRCSSCAIPGIISIPLGFLAVILGSLLYRDRRAEDMWDELYARQNTGILAAKAAAH